MEYHWHIPQEIIEINRKRIEENNKPYNPLLGTVVSDEIKRVEIEIPDAPLPKMLIPVEMEVEPIVQALRKGGSLRNTARGMFGSVSGASEMMRVWRSFVRCRQRYDFEFWCVTKWNIQDKESGETVPFVLNRPQRTVLVPELERLRKANKPIDIILLKARQWGGSTCTDAYQAWIQNEWRENWNSVICADIEDQAKIVLGMMETAFTFYDVSLTGEEKPELKPYMGSQSTRKISTNGATVSIGSAQKPEKIRSQNLKMAHLTEVGIWKATLKKKPEDLVQAIFGSINPGPYTMKVLESTAKGVGNYFHKVYQAAKKGKNNFTPVFVAWFQIDIYQSIVPNYEEFIASMDENERWLFTLGATLEAIAWYRMKDREFEGEHWRMCSEFPSTDVEAFQSTGSNYFPNDYVDEQYKNVFEPSFVGDIAGRDPKGVHALEDLRLEQRKNGCLKIWKDADHQTKMRNRYLVTVDLGKGHTATADNSVICVIDRYWQVEANGLPEVAAEWAGHLDMDLLAWKAAQIASYYNNALLVIESNTIETATVDYFRTVLVEIKDFYRNLYKRSPANKTDNSSPTERYGWSTNGSSKPQICSMLKTCLREGLYIERCREAVDEMKVFEEKPDGTLGAVDGQHDDRVITRAIALYFIYKPIMSPVTYAEEKKETAPEYSTEPVYNEFTL